MEHLESFVQIIYNNLYVSRYLRIMNIYGQLNALSIAAFT